MTELEEGIEIQLLIINYKARLKQLTEDDKDYIATKALLDRNRLKLAEYKRKKDIL